MAQEASGGSKNLCLSISCTEFKSSYPEIFFKENDSWPKNRFLKVCKICTENILVEEILKCVLQSYQALDLKDIEQGEKDRILFLQGLQSKIDSNLLTPLNGRAEFNKFIEFLEGLENSGNDLPKVISTIKNHWGKQNPSCPMCNENGRSPQNLAICGYDAKRNPIFCQNFTTHPINPRDLLP